MTTRPARDMGRMMWGRGFWRRLRAIVVKEVQQLRRDRLTFAMMFGVPIMQLLLFGYAIDTDPHHLPAAVISAGLCTSRTKAK